MKVVEEIERRLRHGLRPRHLEIHDESARHVGHRGATSGGGHYRALIVSEAFEGMTLLARHRAVNEILRDLFGPGIHALALKTLTPGEWTGAEI